MTRRSMKSILAATLGIAGVLAVFLSSLAASGDSPADPAWTARLKQYLESSRSEHNHAVLTWRDEAAWNFDDGKMPADFKVFDGKWDVADGKLRAIDGKDDDNRTIKIADCRWPAFRLEFDAMLRAKPGVPADHVCDIGILLNADPDTGRFDHGYGVLAGTYFNQATVLYRLYIPYARTEWSPIVTGHVHHVMLEVVKPHIRFWIDGRVVLEAWERTGKGPADASDFIDMDPQSVIALHTYDTVMEVDNLRIQVPADSEPGK